MKLMSSLFLVCLSTVALAGAPSNDCTVLRGALVASTVLPGQNSGYGDATYWAKVFEMNRDNANAIANDLGHRVSSLLTSKSRATALKEIAQNIKSARQEGYGDANYWTTIVADQVNFYSTCAHNLVTLAKLTCNE